VSVAERLASVRARIEAACARAGRNPGEVALVAVSKTHSAQQVRLAYEAGQRLFGENYVQELVAKAEALRDLPELRWHFIGHLQRNKAKEVARLSRCVETVDSVRLADALARRVDPSGAPIEVLVQVNVAREPRKSGCAPEELAAIIEHVRALPTLALRGLMTIPPLSADPEEARPHFRALRALAAAHGLRELSMGMSGDLEVAIEEGATIVRVGTAIFGPRA
jgi:pyridoxal phosphate enzyme (YggS family)